MLIFSNKVFNQFNTSNINLCFVPDDGSKAPKHVVLWQVLLLAHNNVSSCVWRELL
jgi:hypothetical protein